MAIEVFKTNVVQQEDALILVDALAAAFPHSRINFDLDDCDRILRVDSSELINDGVFELMDRFGFECYVLEG